MDTSAELSPNFEKIIQQNTDKTTGIAYHRKTHPLEIPMEIEMRLRYPEQWQEFSQAAQWYERLASNKDWTVPEIPDERVLADINLLKYLDKIDFGDVARQDRYLSALSVLDYCHNPHRMAKRTGLPENAIKFTSQEARHRVEELCARLSEDGYGPEHPNPAISGALRRPYVIFLTNADMTKIYGTPVTGLGNYLSAAALVNANSPNLLNTAVHENLHLVRLAGQDKLHYQFLPDDRLRDNLEEGCTVMATDAAMSRAGFHTPNTSRNYQEAAEAISHGLIPKLLAKAKEGWVSTDLPHPYPTPTQLKTILVARFLLGDYELLDRLCREGYYNRDPYKTGIRNFGRGIHHEPWNHVQKVLRAVDVFGMETEFMNHFSTVKSPTDRAFQQIDVRGQTYLSLPLQYEPDLVLLPDYRYEVKGDKDEDWISVPSDQIPVRAIPGSLRINYINVAADWVKP